MQRLIESLERRFLFATIELSPGAAAATSILQAKDNTTFLLHAGTYPAINVDNAGLTLQPFGDGPVIIKAGSADFGLYDEPTGDNLTLIGLDISGGNYYALKTETTRTNNHQANADGAVGLTVIGCKIHDSGTHVLKLSPDCDRTTIRDCEIYNSGRRDAAQGQGVDAVNIDDLEFAGNYIHDCTQNGIFVKGGSQRCVIENNRIVGGWSGIYLGQDTDKASFDTLQNPQMYESLNCVARGNVILNPQYSGIGAGSALNPDIENNWISKTRSGQGGFYYFPNSFGTQGTPGTLKGNLLYASGSIPFITTAGGSVAPSAAGNTFSRSPLPPAKDLTGDGRVNIDDFLKIDRVIGQGSAGAWWTGDVNLDGVVNVDDYLALA